MEMTFNSIARLVTFMKKLEHETYPELPMEQHDLITKQMLNSLLEKYCIPREARILDIGCGQGPALDILRDKGCRATGITVNDEDLRVCRAKGHDVLKMDQSFLEFPDNRFDLLWARHVVEHSIFPYFTLAEFYRVLAPGGLLYLEVPAPETNCHHERNRNHYSVLNRGMWQSLLERSGFTQLEQVNFNFETQMGPDEYWMFLCRKPA